MQISHPHVLSMYDVFEDDKFVFLVTRLAKKGDLFSEVHRGNCCVLLVLVFVLLFSVLTLFSL